MNVPISSEIVLIRFLYSSWSNESVDWKENLAAVYDLTNTRGVTDALPAQERAGAFWALSEYFQRTPSPRLVARQLQDGGITGLRACEASGEIMLNMQRGLRRWLCGKLAVSVSQVALVYQFTLSPPAVQLL
jgi:hypothetical protein